MTVGYRTFSNTQLAIESTAGTDLAATEIWRGPVMFPDDARNMVFPAEDVAIAGGTDRSNVTNYLANLKFPECDLTFEQGPYPFVCSVKNVATGAADGSGSGKVYAYPFATTAPPTIKTLTVEGYDNVQEYESNYVIAQKIKISGKRREALRISWEAFGQNVTPSSKTGSLSLSTVETVNFGNGKFYLDATSGTIGTTQKLLTFVGFELDIDPATFPIFSGDGALTFGQHKAGAWKPGGNPIKGKVMFEHDATATAAFTDYQAQTPRLVRMNFEGSALTTPGTTYSKRTFRVDMPIKWTKRSFSEEDGDNIVTMEFISNYNTTYGANPTVTFVNERTAL